MLRRLVNRVRRVRTTSKSARQAAIHPSAMDQKCTEESKDGSAVVTPTTRRATITEPPPPKYEEELPDGRILPVGPAPGEFAAFNHMVDMRLQELESRLARLEGVFLDLQQDIRTSNQAPNGQPLLYHFYRRSKSALRQVRNRFRCATRSWVVKQTLGLTICLGSGLGKYYRYREIHPKAKYYEEDVEKLLEVYRQHYR